MSPTRKHVAIRSAHGSRAAASRRALGVALTGVCLAAVGLAEAPRDGAASALAAVAATAAEPGETLTTATWPLGGESTGPQGAGRIDGISDQNLALWNRLPASGPLAGDLRATFAAGLPPQIRYARYVVQWNVIARRATQPYRHYFEALASWYQRTRELGLVPDLALGLFTGAPPASTEAYARALQELLAAFPVPYVEAWNEPNFTAGLGPAAAAGFMDTAYGYCLVHGCTAIAGDFLDIPGAAAYAARYQRALSPTEYPRSRDPGNWGLHPYVAVNRGGDEAQAIRRALPAGDQLWITEVGAYYCEAPGDVSGFGEAGQADAASRLVDTVIPALDPLHVFYYEVMYKQGELTPCHEESDTALYAGASDRPRTAAAVLFGA